MKLMLQSLPVEVRFWSTNRTPQAAVAWRMEAQRVAPEPQLSVARSTLLVPSEDLLLLAVDLPLPSHRKRVEMLPFAIEDRIAQAEGEVHLALGPQLADRRYLAAVVSHATMERWIAIQDAEGLEQASLVPDVLAVPWPGEEAWQIDVRGDRALVRTSNGAGFALPLASLGIAWAAAGRPLCRIVGGQAPDYLRIDAGDAPAALVGPMLDLRTGRYARRRTASPRALKRLGWVAAGGILAHATIAAADSYALQTLAERRKQETRAIVAALAPGRSVGDDVVDAATALLPAGEAGMPQSSFVPLLGRVAGSSVGTATQWQRLSYGERDARLTLEAEAEGAEALEAARNALAATGLKAQLDQVDIAADGGMRGRFRIASGDPAL